MEEIKAFTEEHLCDVGGIYMRTGRGLSRPAPQPLLDAFRENFLRNPWVTPDIPSLVYIENGKLVGFIGVIPRPMEFRGVQSEPLRSTCGWWITKPIGDWRE